MPVRKTAREKDVANLYFKLPMVMARCITGSAFLKQNAHYIIAFTILTNHMHAIIAFHNIEKRLTALFAMAEDLLHMIS